MALRASRYFLATLATLLLGALALWVGLSCRNFYVPGPSMAPGLPSGSLVVVRGRFQLERGAVVVVAPPANPISRDPLLKRVVGVGGDTVEVRDGRLVLNGEPAPREPVPGPCERETREARTDLWRVDACRAWTETVGQHAYGTLCGEAECGNDLPPTKVPAGQVWLLGDNRDHSADSRHFGPVAEGAVLGQAEWLLVRFGPHGADRFLEQVR